MSPEQVRAGAVDATLGSVRRRHRPMRARHRAAAVRWCLAPRGGVAHRRSGSRAAAERGARLAGGVHLALLGEVARAPLSIGARAGERARTSRCRRDRRRASAATPSGARARSGGGGGGPRPGARRLAARPPRAARHAIDRHAVVDRGDAVRDLSPEKRPGVPLGRHRRGRAHGAGARRRTACRRTHLVVLVSRHQRRRTHDRAEARRRHAARGQRATRRRARPHLRAASERG